MKRIRCISRKRPIEARVHQGFGLSVMEKALTSLLAKVFPDDKEGPPVIED